MESQDFSMDDFGKGIDEWTASGGVPSVPTMEELASFLGEDADDSAHDGEG